MELTHELRENAGLQWVLERLSPLSPFGKQAARTPGGTAPARRPPWRRSWTTWPWPWSCGPPAAPPPGGGGLRLRGSPREPRRPQRTRRRPCGA